MSFRVAVKIEGLEPLLKKMAELRKGLRTKVLRSAMRKSASLVNKAAKAGLRVGPEATGQLKKSLGVKVKVYPSGVVIGVVEPRSGFRVTTARSDRRALASYAYGDKAVRGGWKGPRWHDPRMIAHLIERGTKTRQNKRGANRGAVGARPFLMPAFAANAERIVGIFGEELAKELAKL